MNTTHCRTHHQLPDTGPVRLPTLRQRRKSLRHRFCDGIEAAVKGAPEAVIGTKPRTVLGLIVRNLVRNASEGRCDAVRLVVFFLDEGERRRVAAEQAAMGQSQGLSGAAPPSEPEWDWNEEGAWGSSGRESASEDRRLEDAAGAAKTEALPAELRENFLHTAKAGRINAEHEVRLETEREGRGVIAAPEGAPLSGISAACGDAPGSGNFPGASAATPNSGKFRPEGTDCGPASPSWPGVRPGYP